MKYVLILGSNLSNRKKNLNLAIEYIRQYKSLNNEKTSILKKTNVLETKPVLIHKQNNFLNQGILIETQLSPLALLKVLKSIEEKIGRIKRDRYTAREIDIDIVWWQKGSYHHQDLTIPHIYNHVRHWVLKFLVELCPNEKNEHGYYYKNLQKEFIMNIQDFIKKKKSNEKITMLTCYDYTSAKILSHTPVDLILIGDSLGNVIKGDNDTLSVTVDEIIYHSKAVRKAMPDVFLIADMPFLSYHISEEKTIENAGRILKETGVNAIKLEGVQFISHIKKLIAASIPVMGHLGLTPQSVHAFGGYKLQAKSETQKEQLLKDALLLQEAGCFAIVLEMVPSDIAKKVSEALQIPVVGIGAGPNVDGQVLVLQDMLGMNSDFSPKFVRQYADLSNTIITAVNNYCHDVTQNKFPSNDESY